MPIAEPEPEMEMGPEYEAWCLLENTKRLLGHSDPELLEVLEEIVEIASRFQARMESLQANIRKVA